MKKLTLKTVFIDPKKEYELVDETNTRFFKDSEGNGYLKTEDNKIQSVIKTFMVVDNNATKPVWFKRLKTLGINITSSDEVLEVENTSQEEFSYRLSDNSWIKVNAEEVLNGDKGYFIIIDGVVQKLFKRNIKKFTINGVNVGNEYYCNKLLGLNQSAKK